jgi:hypothetical protein
MVRNKKEVMSKTKQWLMETYGDDLSGMPQPENSEPTPEETQEAYEYFEAAKTFPTIAEKKDLVYKSIKDQIMQGYLNPLEFYRQAKIIIDTVEALKKDPDVFDCAWTEREKYGKEKPVINGSTIDNGQRITYDYESTGDPVYIRLKEELKQREAFLKAVKEEMTIVDTETGDTITIKPAVQRVSTFITVKI